MVSLPPSVIGQLLKPHGTLALRGDARCQGAVLSPQRRVKGFPSLTFTAEHDTMLRPHSDGSPKRNEPPVDWSEVIPESFMDPQGRPRRVLERIAARYAVVLHCLSLSIGSTEPIDFHYVRRVKELAAEVGAAWVSDHVCWTAVGGVNTHELLPIPFTEESLAHVVDRVRTAQEFLGAPLIFENPSSYVTRHVSGQPGCNRRLPRVG